MTAEAPAFKPASSIELQSVTDSKITGVSLYSSRAEITRLYKFGVKVGHNQVNISGLPNILETESLRVEGRGAATIHDVTVSKAKGEHVPATSSPELATLLTKRTATASALARCEKSLVSLDQYLSSLTVEHLEVSKLQSVMENYDSTGEKLDVRKADLTEQLRLIDAEIVLEIARIAVPHENDKLRVKAAIGVFAEAASDVEIALIYAVPLATWTAFYDIRVDMSTKEDPITLIYKAAITQNTGESWADVPLILETSTPTFGISIPQLSPWNLSFNHYAGLKSRAPSAGFSSEMKKEKDSRRYRAISSGSEDSDETEGGEPLGVRDASVTSKGNVNATFRVPGLVSIPSDGEAHNFTIVQLNLQASMSWVSVPKVDTKAHINVNAVFRSHSASRLRGFTGANHQRFRIHALSGTASVYVDGSFISRSEVPPVSPKESFDCPLGVDPSIRITYHPVIKKLSRSGFYTKSVNYVFAQRITVFNTKSIAVDRLKIVDQIPASQNAQIEVKLTNPALTLPAQSNAGGSSIKGAPKAAAPQVLNVARGVTAQWDGVDEPDCAVEALGLDRKLNWICTVPPQGKMNLTLEWEVTVSPTSAQVLGL
ncbi:hypothetical protein B0H17DRAFT_954241 [Mycena rosella]|uniref:Mucoidy inhibitor A n=1 Tax=Mycena rosella TaxID=1033263 RepID=A0AAD7CRY2_MYCRO|nr:hypothetical protein B0H17DRAFT_954241 [Mycena rosella]